MQSSDDFQTQVLARLDELKGDIAQVDGRLNKLETEVKENGTKFDAFQKGTDGMVKMATTIIITAGTVTILSPFVQSVAPAIRSVLGSNAG